MKKPRKNSEEFAVFVVTRERPDRMHTLRTLKAGGYTGKIYLIVEDADPTLEEYRKNFGDMVQTFSKAEILPSFDLGDNFPDWRVVIFARNACFDIAKRLGVKYFLMLDDDYTSFSYRFAVDSSYEHKQIRKLDEIFAAILVFYKKTTALSVAIAQGGDFLGGSKGTYGKEIKLTRKCMNTFFCSTDREFRFVGRVNEDVNTYVARGREGDLFFTINSLSINQVQTQSNAGGMTDTYKKDGTYVKSFYSVIYCPSAVKVAMLNSKNKRLHHKVNWPHAVPVIVSEALKKAT